MIEYQTDCSNSLTVRTTEPERLTKNHIARKLLLTNTCETTDQGMRCAEAAWTVIGSGRITTLRTKTALFGRLILSNFVARTSEPAFSNSPLSDTPTKKPLVPKKKGGRQAPQSPNFVGKL